ncbi:MAG: hypothetical protein HYY04_10585 [Chloroflexi bacterium]|nr:hypothetical protein [Chloroflexota bacterium]
MNRELFHATMRRENGDRLLHIVQGFLPKVEEWQVQGLPEEIVQPPFVGVSPTPDLFDHFNVSKLAHCRFEQFHIPAFEEIVISDREGVKTVRNSRGNVLQTRSDGGASLPHEVDFAIRSRADYERLRDRLVGHVDQRAPLDELAALGESVRNQQDHLVSLRVHGPFGFLRELLGVERAILVPYDDPDWTRLLLDDHLDVSVEAGARVAEACRPDFSFVWEDCCGSSGPMVSPSVFEEFYEPWYRRWKSFLRDVGVPWMVVDTDGDPTPLVGPMMEAGVDGILPWEVNSVDALQIAREYPDLVLIGGIYKHIFEPADLAQAGRFRSTDARQAIDEEIERVVKPLRRRGGYLPALDHWVPRAARYPDFRYYCERLVEKYGVVNRSLRFRMVHPVFGPGGG